MTTTAAVSLNENLTSSSPNTILTITITSLTPTVSSESALITDSPNTVSSDLTLVYVFTKSATDDSSSSSASSSSSTGNSHAGLSTGAIAGIVIGSVILLIFLVLVVFCTSRGFARKRRREEASLHHSQHLPSRASHAAPGSYHKARSQRSTAYSASPPPQELATQFNRLKVDGRGRPVEVLGSYKHPVELQAGSTADLVAHARKGSRPPAGSGKSGVASVTYLMPSRRGDDVSSDAGSGGCLSPGTWETESWAASVSGQSLMVSGPGTHATPSKASSRDTLGYNTYAKE